MKSIMQPYDRSRGSSCYLCQKLNGDYWDKYTEEHHAIGGTANRKLSEKYGLKVRLCIYHHREGREAVHNNINNMRLLQKDAQLAFEQHYPNLSFRDIFGMNYLTEEDRKPHKDKIGQGFFPMEGENYDYKKRCFGD